MPVKSLSPPRPPIPHDLGGRQWAALRQGRSPRSTQIPCRASAPSSAPPSAAGWALGTRLMLCITAQHRLPDGFAPAVDVLATEGSLTDSPDAAAHPRAFLGVLSLCATRCSRPAPKQPLPGHPGPPRGGAQTKVRAPVLPTPRTEGGLEKRGAVATQCWYHPPWGTRVTFRNIKHNFLTCFLNTNDMR